MHCGHNLSTLVHPQIGANSYTPDAYDVCLKCLNSKTEIALKAALTTRLQKPSNHHEFSILSMQTAVSWNGNPGWEQGSWDTSPETWREQFQSRSFEMCTVPNNGVSRAHRHQAHRQSPRRHSGEG